MADEQDRIREDGGAVGVNNRQRRADKQRKRARQGARQRTRDEAYGPLGEQVEAIQEVLVKAAYATARGDAEAAGGCATALATKPSADHDRLVDVAAESVLGHIVTYQWTQGWLPVDLHEIARRRTTPLAATLVADVVAAVTGTHPRSAVHPQWHAQVERTGDGTWWDPSGPMLTQWARRHGRDRADALAEVVRLLAALTELPPLAGLLPPPGSAVSGADARADGVDERVLAKVRALLAKAESTEFAEEAEALSAKAQELMTRYALERAVVEADAGPPRASARRLWIDNPYAEAKSLLVAAVADANRGRAISSKELGFVTVLGDEGDLDLVELLATSLLVQATTAMIAAGRHTDRRGASRTRSFRQSFLVAYAGRIGERLREADAAATEVAEEADARLLPVLSARREAVEATLEEMFPHLVMRTVGVSNAAGYGAGRAAADLARLDTRSAVTAPG